jgi:hypothetical protein
MIPNSDASERVGVEKRSIITGALISREYFNDAGYPGSAQNLGSYNTGIMEFRGVVVPLIVPSPILVNSDPSCVKSSNPATNIAGPVVPVVSPVWSALCEGGGVVPTAADIVPAELWDY